MTNLQDAKEYLLQYKRMLVRIKSVEAVIDELREERESIGSDITAMPKGSDISDKTGSLAVQLADMESKLVDIRSDAWHICMDIVNTISKVDDPACARLLHLRYIEMKTWEQISDEMYYSCRWVYGSLHSIALQKVDEILKRRVN